MDSLWIGFDPREAQAYAVARHSIERQLTTPLPVFGVVLDDVRRRGLYWRQTSQVGNKLYDEISEHPMSTEFAISRFLVPYMARSEGLDGWAVFIDCDMLALGNFARLYDQLDDRFAVMCVKHDHEPDRLVKMDGQLQSRYRRKNWSSVMAFNVDDPRNEALTLDLVNSVPGRDLHAFCWLEDDAIGALDPRWNYLVGHSKLADGEVPHLVHFTDGIPTMQGYEDAEYANEWRHELTSWAK